MTNSAGQGAGPPTGWQPTKVVVVDLEEPLPAIDPNGPGGLRFSRLWVLVRRAGRPIRLLTLALDGPLSSAALRQQVEAELSRGPDVPPLPAPADGADLPAISVVVCSTFARYEQLVACVGALEASDYPDFELIVVDNRRVPNAGQYAALRQAAPRVQVVPEQCLGASRARNRGLEACRHDLVAFTDDDVIVDRGWLRHLALALRAAPDIACATGLMIPNDVVSEAQALFEEFYGGFNRTLVPRVFSAETGRTEPLYPYAPGQFGTGASMAFRAGPLREVGGFDPALGPGRPAKGGEDSAVFIKLLERGYRLSVEPAAIARHTHPATYEEVSRRVRCYGIGLIAMLTGLVVGDRRHLARIARRLPRAVVALARSRRGTVTQRPPEVPIPPGLYLQQVAGMLWGPPAYLISRWSTRNSTPAL